EPTNDLDAETLDLLEEQLMQFQGTLLLVSHDREFIDNVVTSTLVFEQGRINEYVGGYQDWLRQRPAEKAEKPEKAGKKPAGKPAAAEKSDTRRLSYSERIELEKLPAEIEQLEAELAALHARMSEPDFYQQDAATLSAAQEQLARLEST